MLVALYPFKRQIDHLFLVEKHKTNKKTVGNCSEDFGLVERTKLDVNGESRWNLK